MSLRNMETMHQIKIGDSLYRELVEVQKQKRLSSVGAACEYIIEKMKNEIAEARQ